ncbi:MAG: hypothetical protein ACPGO5_02085 [Patescibacteria group bacterium]
MPGLPSNRNVVIYHPDAADNPSSRHRIRLYNLLYKQFKIIGNEEKFWRRLSRCDDLLKQVKVKAGGGARSRKVSHPPLCFKDVMEMFLHGHIFDERKKSQISACPDMTPHEIERSIGIACAIVGVTDKDTINILPGDQFILNSLHDLYSKSGSQEKTLIQPSAKKSRKKRKDTAEKDKRILVFLRGKVQASGYETTHNSRQYKILPWVLKGVLQQLVDAGFAKTTESARILVNRLKKTGLLYQPSQKNNPRVYVLLPKSGEQEAATSLIKPIKSSGKTGLIVSGQDKKKKRPKKRSESSLVKPSVPGAIFTLATAMCKLCIERNGLRKVGMLLKSDGHDMPAAVEDSIGRRTKSLADLQKAIKTLKG